MKYPHTAYFSFSPSADKKDVRESGIFDLKNFLNKRLVFTTKQDGSNCVLDSEKVAARNGFDANHLSFDYIKSRHAAIKHLIPQNLKIYGENLYAKHSIHYTGVYALRDYFQVFAIYDEISGIWLSWEDVTQLTNRLGLITVPNDWGIVNSNDNLVELENFMKCAGEDRIKYANAEGIVVRNADAFYFDQFKYNVAKYVRKNHVQTNSHWSQMPIVRNELL